MKAVALRTAPPRSSVGAKPAEKPPLAKVPPPEAPPAEAPPGALQRLIDRFR